MGRFNPNERLGVSKSDFIFTKELKWVFREQPLVDVGIDALIEESIDGNPTGKFLAAQIKTGLGNFLLTDNSLILYVSRIHHTYWLNLDFPIILLAYISEDDRIYWQLINEQSLRETKMRWKLEISKNKILGKDSKEELVRVIYREPQNDFITQLKAGNVSEETFIELASKSTYFNAPKDSMERLSEIATKYIEGQTKFIRDSEFCIANEFSKTHPKVKSAIKQFSQIIDSTSHQFEKEIDVFSDSFATAFREFEKLLLVYFHFTDDYEHLKVNFDRLGNFGMVINNTNSRKKRRIMSE